jgi:hypothetical protein
MPQRHNTGHLYSVLPGEEEGHDEGHSVASGGAPLTGSGPTAAEDVATGSEGYGVPSASGARIGGATTGPVCELWPLVQLAGPMVISQLIDGLTQQVHQPIWHWAPC